MRASVHPSRLLRSGRRAGAGLVVLAWAAVAALAACGRGDGGGSAGPSLAGRFVARTAQGTAVLTVREGDGGVQMTVNGQTVTGHQVAPGRVEGEETTENGRVAYVLERRGEGLVLRLAVIGGDGQRMEAPDVVFEPAPSAPAGEERDAALVGHWRSTSSRSGGTYSSATDEHYVLEEDGSYTTWSRTVDTFGDHETPRARGAWRTSGGTLHLRPEGSPEWEEAGRYETSGGHLLVTGGSGAKRIYERVG